METCPYCGEEQYALKNHVRLASGNGHGPSGTYPEDFEDGPRDTPAKDTVSPSPGKETPADTTHEASDDPNTGEDADTINLTQTEFDNALDQAREDGYTDGFDDGYEFVEQELQVETPDEKNNANNKKELPCGHESINPSKAPAPPFNVTCETCGETFGWTE